MGSLRNPVGPLPSSIYWRRRAVVLSVVAVLALLIVWAVNSAGSSGGGGQDKAAKGGGGPAETITPGPSTSGPAISERPGGRDESKEADRGSDEAGHGDGASDGPGDGDNGTSDRPGGSGSVGGSGVPAGTSLPDCTSAAVRLSVRSVKNSYAPDEKPEFELVAKNSSSKTCKMDFGPRDAVMTITYADDDDPIWASDDCPKDDGHLLLQVPAGGEASQTTVWDRKPSEPECATPRPGSAKPGTYLVEVRTSGMPTARVSFSLAKD